MRSIAAKDVLKLPMQQNDAGAETIGEYLTFLLELVWEEEEGFDGKRPFGNSNWQHEVYQALIKAGVVEGKLDQDGYIQSFDRHEAEKLVRWTILRMWTG